PLAFLALLPPLGRWLGAGLLSMRLWSSGLARGRTALAAILRPIGRGLQGAVAASLSRRGALVTRGVALVALSFSFGTSTAIFNSTYSAQARVDAEFTNGADVAVSGSLPRP